MRWRGLGGWRDCRGVAKGSALGIEAAEAPRRGGGREGEGACLE